MPQTYIKIKHESTINKNYNHCKIFEVGYQRFYMESNRYMFFDNITMWPATSLQIVMFATKPIN